MKNNIIRWWKTDLGAEELQGVKDAFDNRCITQGQKVKELEARICDRLGVPYAVVTVNGSMALVMALMACGVGPGDEVIIPNLTFVATAQAPALLGAKVVLTDVEKNNPVMSVDSLKSALSSRTKVIIPVHLNGRSADMREIRAIAKTRGIRVIEDTAQGFCSSNADGFLGTQSDIGSFSMGVTKLITTAKGGFLVTSDEKIYQRLKSIRSHGLKGEKGIHAEYDILGLNFECTDILASIGLAQMKKIDKKIERHKEIYCFYKKALAGNDNYKVIEFDLEKGELPIWTEILCKNRQKTIELLEKAGIEGKPFDPCMTDSLKIADSDLFPNSVYYSRHGLILPGGPDQKQEDLERVVNVLRGKR